MTAKLPQDDAERLALVRKSLFSSVIGDVLDAMGFLHQFLPPEIRPLSPDMVLVGRAMPVVEEATALWDAGADCVIVHPLAFTRSPDDLPTLRQSLCSRRASLGERVRRRNPKSVACSPST